MTYLDKKFESIQNKNNNKNISKAKNITPKYIQEKLKSEKIIIINNICNNYINKIFENVKYKEDIKEDSKEQLKKIILESKDLYQNVENSKKMELNLEINIIIVKTMKLITSKIESYPTNNYYNWEAEKENFPSKCDETIEKRLRWTLEFSQKAKRNKYPEHNELELIADILIEQSKEEKIIDECRSDKKEELMGIIKELAKLMLRNIIIVGKDIYIKKQKFVQFQEIKIQILQEEN